MMKRAAIIDLDNCISDDQWRLKYIEMHHEQPNDRYWEYHERCIGDVYLNRHIIDQLSETHCLLIFTSRPETVRFKTESWLNAARITYDLLYMRPIADHSPSVELKRQMLARLPADYQVEVAIDDRQDVLEMYRQQGISVAQRIFIYEPKEL